MKQLKGDMERTIQLRNPARSISVFTGTSNLHSPPICSTGSVVCPCCGYYHDITRDFHTGTYHCHDCGKLFALLVETVTTYKTCAMEPSNVHADDPDEVCEVCDNAEHNVKHCVDCVNHCNFKELPH